MSAWQRGPWWGVPGGGLGGRGASVSCDQGALGPMPVRPGRDLPHEGPSAGASAGVSGTRDPRPRTHACAFCASSGSLPPALKPECILAKHAFSGKRGRVLGRDFSLLSTWPTEGEEALDAAVGAGAPHLMEPDLCL